MFVAWNLFYQATLENRTLTDAIIIPIITVWMLLLLLAFSWVVAPAAEDGVTASAGHSSIHWVSSFDETGPVPAGHCWHEFATENGFNIGFDMKLPAGQHPSRPVTPDVNPLSEDNDCHSPPHKVRLKPLIQNTEQRNTWMYKWVIEQITWNKPLNKKTKRSESWTYLSPWSSLDPWPTLKCPHWMQQHQ